MKRNPKYEDTTVVQQDEPDIVALLVKMQQQLMNLEKKIDSLISQSSERPKPFARFDRFRRHENRDHGSSYGERSFTKAICAECHKECEVPFKPSGDRPVYCKDCFSRRKQGDFTPTHFSDKKHSRKHPGHGARKPSFRRRKERA
jgi:CxxC-x17-CxxC domain-containing protein